MAELFPAVLDSASFTPISLDAFDLAVFTIAFGVSIASKMFPQLAVVLSEFATFPRIISLTSANWFVSSSDLTSSMSAVVARAWISNRTLFSTVSVRALASFFSTDYDTFSIDAVCLAFCFYPFDAAKRTCPASLTFAASRILDGDACSMLTACAVDAAWPESATESDIF